MRAKNASVAPPIIYGVALVLVTLILTVLYNIAMVTDWFPDRSTPARGWPQILVIGAGWMMGLAVMTGLILFIISLARQIKLNQQQQNFIDSVTHELKSPLTSLKLHLETMQRRPITHEQLFEFSNTMLHDVDRLDRLIDHVLEAARSEAGRRIPMKAPLEVRAQIAAIIKTLERRHHLTHNTIRLEGPAVTIKTDATAFDVVLTNLLENAIKYSQGPVEVAVRLTPLVSGGISIAVSDQGVGIPKKQLRRIFKRFHRVGNELTRIRQGTGLGLSIVKDTVKALNGSIVASSPGENQGSVFTLTLPG
ncbi:MAG: HAMP domain-containing sensor histidine kinase [Candidatus Sericytochromatia bacterium]|nr:HAMP domain-containing sensor histidine kinase [Candidatus Sericytochromatia bacterium]